jgi:hypothetical protein
VAGGTNCAATGTACTAGACVGTTIQVVSASYGGVNGDTCTGADVTTIVGGFCNGMSASCTFMVNNTTMGGDPSPNCEKNFAATYVCGSNPTQKTAANVPPPVLNENYVITLTCP